MVSPARPILSLAVQPVPENVAGPGAALPSGVEGGSTAPPPTGGGGTVDGGTAAGGAVVGNAEGVGRSTLTGGLHDLIASSSLGQFATLMEDSEITAEQLEPSLRAESEKDNTFLTNDPSGSASLAPSVAPRKKCATPRKKTLSEERASHSRSSSRARDSHSRRASRSASSMAYVASSRSRSSSPVVLHERRASRRYSRKDSSSSAERPRSRYREERLGRSRASSRSHVRGGTSGRGVSGPSRGEVFVWLRGQPGPWEKASIFREACAHFQPTSSAARAGLESELDGALYWLHVGASALNSPPDGGSFDTALFKKMMSVI